MSRSASRVTTAGRRRDKKSQTPNPKTPKKLQISGSNLDFGYWGFEFGAFIISVSDFHVQIARRSRNVKCRATGIDSTNLEKPNHEKISTVYFSRGDRSDSVGRLVPCLRGQRGGRNQVRHKGEKQAQRERQKVRQESLQRRHARSGEWQSREGACQERRDQGRGRSHGHRSRQGER